MKLCKILKIRISTKSSLSLLLAMSDFSPIRERTSK